MFVIYIHTCVYHAMKSVTFPYGKILTNLAGTIKASDEDTLQVCSLKKMFVYARLLETCNNANIVQKHHKHQMDCSSVPNVLYGTVSLIKPKYCT